MGVVAELCFQHGPEQCFRRCKTPRQDEHDDDCLVVSRTSLSLLPPEYDARGRLLGHTSL
jgi:hypothetical protein